MEADDTETDHDFIILNVSGVKYELQTNILRQFPDSLLTSFILGGQNTSGLDLIVRSDRSIFVQRSPQMFELVILQTYVTGKLHVPKWMCAECVLDELKFWRLDLENACKCCAAEAQNDDEDATTVSANDLTEIQEVINKWERCRRWAWDFLDKPSSSLGATVGRFIDFVTVVVDLIFFRR